MTKAPSPTAKRGRTQERSRAATGRAARPLGNGRFLVDLGLGTDPRAPEAGFCEVIFPEFRLDPGEEKGAGPDLLTPAQALAPASPAPHLVLRRAATGALDLYDWWQKARAGKAPRKRTAMVELLDEAGAEVVMRWRFFDVRPVALAYSPLQAMTPGVLYETVSFRFEGMEVQEGAGLLGTRSRTSGVSSALP